MAIVIGRGLIGSTFSRMTGPDRNLVIYASGVSNSGCVDASEFEREERCLKKAFDHHKESKSILYFSTCSVYDHSAENTPYVLHKKRMEEHVLKQPNGYVIRLPQLVGSPGPSTTLVPYLVSKIRNKELIQVWSNSWRNLIDVQDVALIVQSLFAKEQPRERVINIANPYYISVIELIRIIESTLKINAKTVFIPKKSGYYIDTTITQSISQRLGINFGPSYIPQILHKYYS